MKKRAVFLSILTGLIVLILFSNLVLAQEFPPTPATPNKTTTVSGELDKAASNANKTLSDVDQNFGKELSLPDPVKWVVKVLFGLKEKITIQSLAIQIALLIMVFSIIYTVLEFMPFLNTGFQKVLAGIIITLLAAMAGGFQTTASFYIELSSLFGLWNNMGNIGKYLTFLSGLIIAFLIVFFVRILSNILKKYEERTRAEEAGFATGVSVGMVKKFFKGLKESRRN